MEQIVATGASHLYVAACLGALCLAFVLFYCVPAIVLGIRLREFSQALLTMSGDMQPELLTLSIGDRQLRQLWQKYCRTLRLAKAGGTPTAVGDVPAWATIAAEAHFSSSAVIEDRIHRQYFRHFPGLIIGVGLVGAAFGVIDVLKVTTGAGLDVAALVASLREALYLAAATIGLAMLVGLLERLLLSWLRAALSAACQRIDMLYTANAGDESRARSSASKQVEADAPQLPGSLVVELRGLLDQSYERLLQRLAEAQTETEQKFAAERGALATQLEAVVVDIASKAGDIGISHLAIERQLTEQVQSSFEKIFAEMRGHTQSIKAMSTADLANQQQVAEEARRLIESLCAEVRKQSDAIRAMSEEDLASHQQAAEQTRNSIESLYAEVRNQSETIKAMGEADVAAQQQIAEEARKSIRALCEEARVHGQMIEASAKEMKGATSTLTETVDRAIGCIDAGAASAHDAASGIVRSGEVLTGILDSSTSIARTLARSTESLTAASAEVGKIVTDYQSARVSFASMSDSLQQTVEAVSRGATINQDTGLRMAATVEKLAATQSDAADCIDSHKALVAETREAFREQMPAIRSRTRELAGVTELLINAIEAYRDRGHDLVASEDNEPDAKGTELEQALAELRRREKKVNPHSPH